MEQLFANLALVDVHRDLIRNIVSIRQSQDIFDDLSKHPEEWQLAQLVEDEVKPPPYQSATPIIHRPFEDAEWFNAISYPFKHWQSSRFSDGSFGVWYGGDSVETTVHETAHRWYWGLLRDAGFEHEDVVGERKLFSVTCDSALLNLKQAAKKYPALLHKTDYSFTQAVGARLHREGHPGLLTSSVRHESGECYAVLNPVVLSKPQYLTALTYRFNQGRIVVEKIPGQAWMSVEF